MEKERYIRVFGLLISLTIITILLISGPAQAYILGLTSSSNSVERGDKVNFIATVKAEGNETLGIDYLDLKLTAINNIPSFFNCKFLPNGTILSGCEGISIEEISVPGQYGYSYGYDSGYSYGYGAVDTLMYNITLDTTKFLPLEYKTSLSMAVGNKTFEQAGPSILITSIVQPLKNGCSIRAKSSVILVGNKSFDNARLNYYIPLRNAVNGEGYLIGQKNRETFNYEFKNIKIIQNDDNNMVLLLVSGKYRLGLAKKVLETSVINLNKKTNKIDIIGDNVNISGMNVYFKVGC